MIKNLQNSGLFQKVNNISKTATLRQSGITFIGTIANGALGAIFYILAARTLGPSSFGLMSLALSVAMLASSVGDMGTDTGLVRFVSQYLGKDKSEAYRYLKLTFKAKVVAGLVISSVGVLLSPPIARYVFQKPEVTVALQIAFLATICTLLFGFVISYLKALQKFFVWSLIQIGANFFRVLVVLGFLIFGLVSVNSVILAYVLTLLAGFIFGFLFLIPHDFLFVKNETVVARKLFNYNKWVATFTLISAVSSRLDTFITARLMTPADIGVYAAANQLVYIVPQIVGALGTVIAPKMAEMNKDRISDYLKKTQLLVVGLAVLGLIAAPVVAIFVPIIFGVEYSAAIPPFYILLLAMLTFLISVPIHNVILYTYSFPKLFFYLSIGHLIIVGFVGWNLISQFGIIGAAITVLVGTLFNFLIPLGWVLNKLRKTA